VRAAALVFLLGSTTASAEPVERVDTIGTVSGVTWDGRPSTGMVLGVGLTSWLALAGQVRARSGELVENLDLILHVTHGSLESTFGNSVYPIRLDLIGGVGAIERQRYATGSFGIALRIRASRRFTIDFAVRDEVSRVPRPNRFVHVPEVQLALSWTSQRLRIERDE
jgi:hypothetical protein